MNISKGQIGNALESTASDKVVACANAIYDETYGNTTESKNYQDAINKDHLNRIVALEGGSIGTKTVGSATRPIYFNSGTPTACTYTFGNASGNAALNNSTVNTNLNADLLDGKHKDDILRSAMNLSETFSLNDRVVNNGIDFTSWSFSNSSYVNNQPGGDGASSAASVATFGVNYPFQIYSDYNDTNKLFYRSYYNNWKDWKQFAFLDSTVASATKIGTATVGSTARPVYINAGTPTALTANVGTSTKPIYVSSGTMTQCTGNLMTDSQKTFLDNLITQEVQSKFAVAITLSASNVVPSTSVTATITTKYNGSLVDAATLTGGTGALSGIALSGFTKTSTGTYTKSITLTQLGSHSFAVTATYVKDGVTCTKSASTTCGCYNKIIYGWYTGATLPAVNQLKNNSGATGYHEAGPRASAAGTYTWTNNAAGYYYILIPDGCTIPSSLNQSKPQGVEGPLPVFFTKLTGITGFTIYRIADQQAASTHTVVFS